MTFGNFTTLSIPRPVKRRMEDDDDELNATSKRYFDQHTIISPSLPVSEKALPSITYASPDYRPPTQENALWLQPINTNSPMTEDDSNDEDDAMVLTPIYQEEHTHVKPIMNYWGKTVMSQWQ